VRRQTEQLAHLVDDLLDVTRISRGKIQLQREVLDLCNVVRRTCEDHRSLFDQSEIELRLHLPASPVRAEDPTRLAQIVGNLLHNANKFTHAGGMVTVGVTVRGGRAEIRVRDTGIGMEPGWRTCSSHSPRRSAAWRGRGAASGWGSRSPRDSSSCTGAPSTRVARGQGRGRSSC